MKTLLPALLLPLLLLGCDADSPPPADASAAPGSTPAPSEPAADADTGTATGMGAPSLAEVVAGEWRSGDNRARDEFRNPAATLEFFGVEPGHSVVEITPGGGWYAEILAPYLYQRGRYVAAVVDPESLPEDRRGYPQRQRLGLEQLFANAPEQFDRAGIVAYDPAAPVFGEAASADVVLTFRNVHNWLSNEQAEDMFRGFHEVLRPGGVLGVVEHRAGAASKEDSGYVAQDRVVALATEAGFVLEESSEINANPRDPANHPNGVWTLPPTNNHDEPDADRYRSIGESDRMTLRFRKPME